MNKLPDIDWWLLVGGKVGCTSVMLISCVTLRADLPLHVPHHPALHLHLSVEAGMSYDQPCSDGHTRRLCCSLWPMLWAPTA